MPRLARLCLALAGLLLAPASAPAEGPPALAFWDAQHAGSLDYEVRYCDQGVKEVLPVSILSQAGQEAPKKAETLLGHFNSAFRVVASASLPGFRLRVTIDRGPYISQRTEQVFVLPKAGMAYDVTPLVAWDARALSAAKGGPFTITVYIATAEGKLITEKLEGSMLPLAQCPLERELGGHRIELYSEFLSAYVDGDDPFTDELLKRAKDLAYEAGRPAPFVAYQAGAKGVIDQVALLWFLLQKDHRYFRAPSPLVKTRSGVLCVLVDPLRQAYQSDTATQVDGACLVASVLERMGLSCSLMIQPGEIDTLVWLDPQGQQLMLLDLGGLAQSPPPNGVATGAQFNHSRLVLDQSVGAGKENFFAALNRFRQHAPGYQVVNIPLARRKGIAPLTR